MRFEIQRRQKKKRKSKEKNFITRNDNIINMHPDAPIELYLFGL